MKAIPPGLAAVIGVGMLTAGAGVARASPTVVMLAPRDQPQVIRSLSPAVKAQLSDLDVALRIRWVDRLPAGNGCGGSGVRRLAKGRDVVAVLWFRPGPGRVCLVLSPSRGGRVVDRRVAGSGAEGRYDAAAVLLRTALRGSAQRGDPRQRPVPAGPRGLWRTRPLRAPGLARLELELAYSLALVGPGATPLAHGLRLAALVRVHRHWSVFVGYQLEARLPVDGGDGDVELQRYPVDAGARFRWWHGALELGARLGVGFAYTRLRERLPATSSNAVKTSSDWLVFLDLHAYLGVRPVARLLLFVAVGARAYVLNAEYSLDTDEVLLAPWPVQPSLLVGLSVDIF